MGKNSSSDSSTSNTSNSSTSTTAAANSAAAGASTAANTASNSGSYSDGTDAGYAAAKGQLDSSSTAPSGSSAVLSFAGRRMGKSENAALSQATNETEAAHISGIEGPGLQNGNFGSAWTGNSKTGKSTAFGNYTITPSGDGNGTYGNSLTSDDFTSKTTYKNGNKYSSYINENSGTLGGLITTPEGSRYYVDPDGSVYASGNKKIGTVNENGSFIAGRGLDISDSTINEINNTIAAANAAAATNAEGTAVSNPNEIPTASPGVKVMNGVHDADVESSAISSGSANGNLPTEAGFNNDKAKQEVETQYKNINEAMDENKTNYNRDTWNQGMKETSTEAVSDERCKKFVSTCIKHEPFARQGVKKIVEIIRSK